MIAAIRRVDEVQLNNLCSKKWRTRREVSKLRDAILPFFYIWEDYKRFRLEALFDSINNVIDDRGSKPGASL